MEDGLRRRRMREVNQIRRPYRSQNEVAEVAFVRARSHSVAEFSRAYPPPLPPHPQHFPRQSHPGNPSLS